MSASREKKTRQDPSGQGLSEKKLKQQQEERQTHVHHIVYTVLAVLVVLFGVGLLIWNSNFFQSRAAAVTIDGQDYTAADVQYYYNGALQQEIYNSYSGASTMDYTLDPEDQIYDESTGETWRDHLLDVAIQTLTQQAAIANEAQASGYTMSAQAQESLQNTLDSIQAGTITSGEPRVTDIIPAPGYGEDELLRLAAALEQKSEHPLARAIMQRGEELGMKAPEVSSFEALPGNGVIAAMNGKELATGNHKFIITKAAVTDDMRAKAEALTEQGKTPLYFAEGGKLAGVLSIDDIARSGKWDMECAQALCGITANVCRR